MKIGRYGFCALMVVSLAACGGGGSGSGSGNSSGAGTTYTIGGTISGVAASGLVLTDNGGDNLSVASGATSFTFAAPLQSGAAYAVAVATQPTGETCTVASGTGTAMANVMSVAVTCKPLTYTIGGTISGLSASGLVLADNGGDNLSVASGATSFTFATPLQSGATYAVTVATQPTGETCTVASGTGTATANVTSVAVTCKPLYTIGGTISGLAASGLVLTDNGGDNLSVASGATSFTFPTPLQSGATYNVAVAAQPTGQTCTVASGTGTATANVTSVAVSCAAATFSISGSITGLSAAGLKLQYYSGGQILTVNAGSGTFAFTQPVLYGTTVQMSVVAQPYWQWCTPGLNDFSGPITQNITTDSLGCAAANAHVTTLAGSYTVVGHADGTGSAASFNTPSGVAVDASGDIFVADAGNNEIRRVTPQGVVTTLAGSWNTIGHADGTGSAASFYGPEGIAFDPTSGNLFVADTGNNEIREVTPSGVVTTFAGSPTAGHADGNGTSASFNGPTGVAVDSAGDLFVADAGNNEIRMITPTGAVTTLAGSLTAGNTNGTGTAAAFTDPQGIAVDSSETIYVADTGNNEIREVTSSGVVTTLAGSGVAGHADGTGSAASFYGPSGLAVDSVGNVYVVDTNNQEIRAVTHAAVVTTLAGSTSFGHADGTGSSASFRNPFGVAVVDSSGVLYIGDSGNDEIRQITPGN